MTYNLKNVNAEISPAIHGTRKLSFLWFDCPRCSGEKQHKHLVPFDKIGGAMPDGFLVWTHISGETINNITLDPSYFMQTTCGFHCHIRNGVIVMV